MCREVVPGVVPGQIKIIQGFRVPRVPGLKILRFRGTLWPHFYKA